MTPNELAFLSIAEQARLIAKRDLSPVELVRTYLDRIERYDPALRSYITVCAEQALDRARTAEREIAAGHYRGPLHGIPYGVKDQLLTRGVRTTLGSSILADYVPDCDATVITRLEAAGAILIGKHNLEEFGKGGTMVFAHGQPRNPWDLRYSPAGSSSGSGSAVAAGLCSGALGEDTGGSVRSPAAANGIVGVRPTYGRVSRHGGVMYGWTADTIGPLARTVEDAALLLHAIAGFDANDPLTSQRAVPDYTLTLTEDLKGVRLAVVREMTWVEGAHPEVKAAMQDSIDVFTRLGAVVEEVSLSLAKYSVPLLVLTSDADIASMFLPKWLRTRWNDLDEGTRTRIGAAALVPAAIYSRAMRARVLVRRQVLDALSNYDALLSPTKLAGPSPIETMQGDANRSTEARDRISRICTYPFSVANVPAIAVPCGFGADGLPLSLQIAARPFAEATMFRVAHAYERATPWHTRRPELDLTTAAYRAAWSS